MPVRGLPPFMLSAAPLSARGLTKTFARGLARSPRRTAAIESVDIDIHAGELIALVGGAGAGKTTLLQCLGGLLRPDEGKVELFGESFQPGWPPPSVAYVPATPAFYPFLTPRDIIELAVARNPLTARFETSADHLLASLSLERVMATKVVALPPDVLRRVSIAEALAAKPDVILIDSPQTDVVVPFHSSVLELLAARVEEGAAAVVATREVSSLAFAATRLFVMESGRASRTFTLESLGEPIVARIPATAARIVAERVH